ncbi:hypothetical protein [Sporosalibacterium faouarense]|uniref:hypothetical protein n=1 Tax=Sporosalibacterium faouarense TaxID=516123 RepID=UPI00141CC0B9|nr:hypothetical protein [Sporosalibacterium faouarense]MTI48439.1 DUF2207 domain-containing protein [Bacillota bacterium]
MSEIKKDSQTFVAYDYKEVITNSEKISFLIDSYENFGWEVDENVNHKMTTNRVNPYANITLRLKRNRKIMNKMELTRLQRNFEYCIKEIDNLEKSITSQGTMYSLIVGIIGTAFMAGSVFAVTSTPPKILLCIILGIPAFVGWIIPYFIYRNVVRKRTAKVTSLIEDKLDEVYELCEKGSKLL